MCFLKKKEKFMFYWFVFSCLFLYMLFYLMFFLVLFDFYVVGLCIMKWCFCLFVKWKMCWRVEEMGDWIGRNWYVRWGRESVGGCFFYFYGYFDEDDDIVWWYGGWGERGIVVGLCGLVFVGELLVGDGGGIMRKRKRVCLCLCLCLFVWFYCG